MDSGTKALNFQLLHTLNRERAAFGIRDKDYARYRKHCSNKLSKLRQVTGLKHGSGKVYKPTPAITASIVNDASSLLTLLFEAERSLAFAHDLKSHTPPNADHLHDRKAEISKLRRALAYASQLHTVSMDPAMSSRLTKRAVAEIAVYYLGLRAELAFERHHWEQAVGDYVVRRKLLLMLSEEATTSQGRVLADEEMDVTDPLIRFCAYKLGRPESHDVDGIARDFVDEAIAEQYAPFPTLVADVKSEASVAKSTSGMTDWDGQLAPGVKVRHLELVQPMMRAQSAMRELAEKAKSGRSVKSMKLWDRVLTNLGEAEVIAQRLAEADQQTSTSTASLAHQHILQLLLEHRIRRDNILLRQLNKAVRIPLPLRKDVKVTEAKRQEIAKNLTAVLKLYDVIAQSLTALMEIEIVATDQAKSAGVEATESFVRAKRCYTLGLLHTLMVTPDYPAIILLTEQSRLYLVQSRIALQTSSFHLIPDFLTREELNVDALAKQVDSLDTTAKLAWMPSCVPKKTIYDIAFNHIDLPMVELEVAAGKKAAAPKQPVSAAAAAAKVDLPQRIAVEEDEDMEDAEEQHGEDEEEDQTDTPKKSGWFGGLWGGKK